MHVIVLGGGIAGLAAAWKLRREGAEVTIVEANPDVGGRCRTFQWNGLWLIRGAFAFIRSETNLIDQARQLGIYHSDALEDLTKAHAEHILHKRSRVLELRAFSIGDILRMEGIPAREKLALGRAFPALLRQMLRNDPRDPTTAVDLDTISACAYFREHSPQFVDYVLEPTMAMFCGYGEDDFSLAWLIWTMGGFEWAKSWWTFRERGVGALTHALGEHFAVDAGTDLRNAARCRELRYHDRGVEVEIEFDDSAETLRGDAAVVAVPGCLVTDLIPGLDSDRRRFFEQVEYVGGHIAYWLVEGVQLSHPVSLVLPTVDGFERVSNLSAFPMGERRAFVNGEMKGRFCARTRGADAEEILDEAWREIAEVVPELGSASMTDTYLQRNDVALCRRQVGHIRRTADFRALGPLPRVAFAGDYLINSTVGQAHWSGLQAAEQLLASRSR
jgi:oxygen-dependent protoporphyrinogen oxidase